MQPNSAMQNQGAAKIRRWLCFEPSTTGQAPYCSVYLRWTTFLCREQPQPYLKGVDMKKYPLINHSLVCAIMS
jgi:hypothetical protein